MGKGKHATVAARISEDDEGALQAFAEFYRTSVGQLLRWMVEDLVSGEYLPRHLKPMKQVEVGTRRRR